MEAREGNKKCVNCGAQLVGKQRLYCSLDCKMEKFRKDNPEAVKANAKNSYASKKKLQDEIEYYKDSLIRIKEALDQCGLTSEQKQQLDWIFNL